MESVESIGNVAIVSSGKGVIVKGLERTLSESDVGVLLVNAEASEVQKIQNDVNIFILYISEGISEVTACVKGLKDIVDSTGKAVVVVGPKSEWNELKQYDQGLAISAWYEKMLDMEEFSKYIKDYLAKFASGDAKKRILIVNDDTAYAGKVKEWLQGRYRINIVTTGTQAVEFLQQNHVDLVLLDYELPEMSGAEVLKELRADAATKRVSVIFLTSVDAKETIISIMELEPQGYILKNTTKEDLLVRLTQFFQV